MSGNNKGNSSLTNKILNALQWSYEFTSISGITQVRDTKGKVSKFVWFLLALIGCGLTFLAVFKCVQSYLNHDTVTNVEIRSASSIEFPSVTICNQNRVHCRHLYNLIRNCTAVSDLNI